MMDLSETRMQEGVDEGGTQICTEYLQDADWSIGLTADSNSMLRCERQDLSRLHTDNTSNHSNTGDCTMICSPEHTPQSFVCYSEEILMQVAIYCLPLSFLLIRFISHALWHFKHSTEILRASQAILIELIGESKIGCQKNSKIQYGILAFWVTQYVSDKGTWIVELSSNTPTLKISMIVSTIWASMKTMERMPRIEIWK